MPSFRSIFAYLGIALAVSFDGMGVGAAYAVRRLRIPPASLTYISLLTGLLMATSMRLGGLLSGWVTPAAAQSWGGIIIVALGMWQGWQGYMEVLEEKLRSKQPGRTADHSNRDNAIFFLRVKPLGILIQILRDPLSADRDSSGVIDPRESVLLGIALGLDAFAAGFGASLSGFSPLIIPLVAAACPAFLLLGGYLGRVCQSNGTLRKFYALPGLVLVAIGLLKLTGRF